MTYFYTMSQNKEEYKEEISNRHCIFSFVFLTFSSVFAIKFLT